MTISVSHIVYLLYKPLVPFIYCISGVVTLCWITLCSCLVSVDSD